MLISLKRPRQMSISMDHERQYLTRFKVLMERTQMKDSYRGFSLETHCLEGSFETLVDGFLGRSFRRHLGVLNSITSHIITRHMLRS